jgi:serine/threonine-protein kinase HipA
MNRCPITYEPCGSHSYSAKGLHLLNRSLKELKPLPYSPSEQVELAMQMADKLSIQGVQPKLSAIFSVSKESFVPVAKKGNYILKPPHQLWSDLPQNEDLTMRLAALCGIAVPFHGLVYNIDGTLTYFIKRFDRYGKGGKYHVEDFSQLLGFDRETKYTSSMEQLTHKIEEHCTFPALEKEKLFKLILFCFLVGNEDMHLKNFSLIVKDDLISLSPAYDLLNSALVTNSKEELALPLNGKKSNLKQKDFIDYYAKERLKLSTAQVDEVLTSLLESYPLWINLIEVSFLPADKKTKYLALLSARYKRLFM